MCYSSFYCTGFDGYTYSGTGTNPFINNMYFLLGSLNSLFQSFNPNGGRRQCNCYVNSLFDNKNVDVTGIIPAPGSNVPQMSVIDTSGFTLPATPEYPTFTPENVTGTGVGVLAPGILNTGVLPPLPNPLLGAIPGQGTIPPDLLSNPLWMSMLLNAQPRAAQTPQQANPEQAEPTAAVVTPSGNQTNPSAAQLNITTPYTGTAADLNTKLKGALTGKGETFLKAQQQYGINAAFLASICIQESGNGRSNLAQTKNNVGGVRIPGSTQFKTYNNVEECIMDMARFLKSGYADKGINTIASVGAKYCPSNDPTDVNGTNNRWGACVGNIYNQNFA